MDKIRNQTFDWKQYVHKPILLLCFFRLLCDTLLICKKKRGKCSKWAEETEKITEENADLEEIEILYFI